MVRELAAREHERREREGVADDDPLELALARRGATRWIDGSATFTTVLSSMIMNRPNETASSVHHLRFCGARATSRKRAFISAHEVSRR